MKSVFNRLLSAVCAASLLLSLCVMPSSASWDSTRDVIDLDSVSDIEAKLLMPANLEVYGEFLGIGASVTLAEVFWNFVDRVIFDSSVGEVSIAELEQLCSLYSGYFNRPLGDSFADQLFQGTTDIASNILAQVFFGKMPLTFVPKSWGTSGMTRIYCPELDIWVVSSTGRYAYVNEAYFDTSGGGQWIGETTAQDRAEGGTVALHTLDRLNLICNRLKDEGIAVQLKTINVDGKAKYRGIWYNRQFYADPTGNPYVAPYDPNEWASNQERPDTSVKDENGEEIEGLPEDVTSGIDLENMLITLPDGTLSILDSVIYDESTKTYYIDSHDTYNTTNNYYYHWEYHINYTSITYIGQTEEYDKYYEVYYELPDGRDSADLTKEDVEQLNVSVDVIPYGRNADDTSLRSLYHFDGDTRDASYWNYCTDFVWNKGASLTYMDAGAFEGALYLDERVHDFTLTLPSNITAGDFTLQFRYYQSYTAAPVTDSYISFGDVMVFQFSGSSFLDSAGDMLSGTPIGSWNEIAIMRDSGTLYFYLNGVCIGSTPDITSYGNTITFHFGSQQQTYKYFDELRVLNEALVAGGDNYTPTSVPHDTNLVLTTPDQVIPVADEYWQIENTPGYLSYLDFSQGVLPSNLVVTDDSTNSTSRNTKFPNWAYGTDQVNAEAFDNYTAITRTGDTLAGSSQVCGGIHSVVYNNEPYGGFELGKDYTISIIYRDGTVEKIPFTFVNDRKGYNLQADCGLGQVLLYAPNSSIRYHSLVLNTTLNETVELVGVEVCAGDSSLTAEWVESVTVFDKDSLSTPSLAVRTDLEITSHQIGGVRPSVPEKGMVWALVENQRITSLQIYNGQAWEGVDGRMWTGTRWIPASSYNIITLQDMYDIVDATPDYEYIYTESGFWSWWQKSWIAFTDQLFTALGSGGSGGTGADGGDGSNGLDGVDLDAQDPELIPEEEDGKSFWQFVMLLIVGGKSVVGGVREITSGAVSSVPDSVNDIVAAFGSGGLAVGVMDGSYMDPDAADLPQDDSGEAVLVEVEEVDPWRYR